MAATAIRVTPLGTRNWAPPCCEYEQVTVPEASEQLDGSDPVEPLAVAASAPQVTAASTETVAARARWPSLLAAENCQALMAPPPLHIARPPRAEAEPQPTKYTSLEPWRRPGTLVPPRARANPAVLCYGSPETLRLLRRCTEVKRLDRLDARIRISIVKDGNSEPVPSQGCPVPVSC